MDEALRLEDNSTLSARERRWGASDAAEEDEEGEVQPSASQLTLPDPPIDEAERAEIEQVMDAADDEDGDAILGLGSYS